MTSVIAVKLKTKCLIIVVAFQYDISFNATLNFKILAQYLLRFLNKDSSCDDGDTDVSCRIWGYLLLRSLTPLPHLLVPHCSRAPLHSLARLLAHILTQGKEIPLYEFNTFFSPHCALAVWNIVLITTPSVH